MRTHTGARADRFTAAVARLLTVLSALLAALGLTALLWHAPLPLWAWIAWAPDTLTLTVLGALRMLAPRPLAGPFGG